MAATESPTTTKGMPIGVFGALLLGAIISLGVNSAFILAQWMVISSRATDVILWGVLILVFPLLAALLVLPVSLAFMFSRRTRRGALHVTVFALAYIAIAISCIRFSDRVRMYGFARLAARSAPLVQAIKKFDADHGQPPSGLAELVPEYLPSVPTTGMKAYPEYEYLVGEKAERYEDNPWVLVVHTPGGGINFDMFLYFPKDNYPQTAYGSRLERIGDWAYCHE
jgi:hypothetical protein